MKAICLRLCFTLLLFVIAIPTSQAQIGDMSLSKDSLIAILTKYNFEGYCLPSRFPAGFIEKKNKDKFYKIPYTEDILAYVNLSGNEDCKFGLAIGLKGFYISNAGYSTSVGPRYISYSLYKNNEFSRINEKEFRIEFKTIEVKKLPQKDQDQLEKLIREIKTRLLKRS